MEANFSLGVTGWASRMAILSSRVTPDTFACSAAAAAAAAPQLLPSLGGGGGSDSTDPCSSPRKLRVRVHLIGHF